MKKGNARSSDPWRGHLLSEGAGSGANQTVDRRVTRRTFAVVTSRKKTARPVLFLRRPEAVVARSRLAPRLTHPRAARGTAPPGPRARPSRRHPARARPRAPRALASAARVSAPRDPPGPRAFSFISPGGVCLRATRHVRARDAPALAPPSRPAVRAAGSNSARRHRRRDGLAERVARR